MSKKKKIKKFKSQVKKELKRYEKTYNKIVQEFSKLLPITENQKDVKSDILAKSDAPATRDLINHGIDIWRMEQRLNKVLNSLPENSQELLNNSMQKIKRYLDKNDIEIVDYTNQKFNEGRNLDVLAVEKSSDVSESIIKETKEPTILHKNQVVHKGKVIILEKNDEVDTDDQS